MWGVNPGQFEEKYGQNSSYTCIKFAKNKLKIIIKNQTGSTLLEDWDSILSTHVGSNNIYHSSSKRSNALFCLLGIKQACGAQTYMHAKHPYT